MNCSSGMSSPLTDVRASAGFKSLVSGAIVRDASLKRISAIVSVSDFTVPNPCCGCKTFIPTCNSWIFIKRILLRVSFVLPITADQRVRGTIMFQWRLIRRLQLGCNASGQYLPQFHTPLVKGIDIPNHPLGEDRVLVQCYKLTKDFGSQSFD